MTRLLGLKSRKGLRKASERVSLRIVEAEGDGSAESARHTSFFVPCERKKRSDVLPATILEAATAWWIKETRVTPNRKNVVRMRREVRSLHACSTHTYAKYTILSLVQS